MRVPHHALQPQGRPASVRPRREALRGLRRRRRGRRPGSQRAGPERASSAKLIRIAPRAGGGYNVPTDNPFRGRSGARPEIYAYGLRNPYRFSFDRLHRRPDDRRRGPGRGGGDRLRARTAAGAAARRAAATTSAGASSRGSAATGRAARPGARAAGDHALARRRLLLDHRRLRDPRPLARARPVRQVRVRRLLQAQPARRRPCGPATHRRARSRPRCRTSSRSARTGAAACTRSRSTAPCTGWPRAKPSAFS